MQKLSILVFVFLAAMIFVFPVSVLSMDVTQEMDSGPVSSEISEAKVVDVEIPKDERVLALENEYSAMLNALLAEIQNQSDPFERERLQKQVHEIKAEQEIAMKKLFLDISIEKGDEDRAMELDYALDQLYEPKVAEPAVQEPQEKPEDGNINRKFPKKNPDDA